MLSNLIFDPEDYKRIKHIGQGQFGKVTLVQKNNDQYALKILCEEMQDSDSASLFVREVSTLAFLKHPSILAFRGFAIPTKLNKNYYLLTDFMPNGTLKDLTKRDSNGRFSEKLTPTVQTICAIGIAAGMKYVHQKNIVHRDLKPENIFFDSNFYPKIADFGLAKFIIEQKYTGNLGTPYFMAPELFGDEKKIGSAIDVYAYAVVLLSSFDPVFRFDGKQPKTMMSLAAYISSGKRFKIPGSVPESYKNLIQLCWDQTPKNRPTFDYIYDLLTEKKEFILEGAEKKEIKKYIKLISNIDDNHNQGKEEEDVQETAEFDFGL